MQNPLLELPEYQKKYDEFSKKNYETKKSTFKKKIEAIERNEEYKPKERDPDGLYSAALRINPNLKQVQKIYSYVSCLNTGKLKTVNSEKLKEYHIKYNEDTKKFYADRRYIHQVMIGQ